MRKFLFLLLICGLPVRADLPNPLDSTIPVPTSYRATLHLDSQFQKGDYAISYTRDDRGVIQAFTLESVLTHYHFRISNVMAGQRTLAIDGYAHLRFDYQGGADAQQVSIDQNGNTSAAQTVPLSEVPQVGILPLSVSGRNFIGRETINGEVTRHYRVPGFPTTDLWIDDRDGHVVATMQGGMSYIWSGFAAN